MARFSAEMRGVTQFPSNMLITPETIVGEPEPTHTVCNLLRELLLRCALGGTLRCALGGALRCTFGCAALGCAFVGFFFLGMMFLFCLGRCTLGGAFCSICRSVSRSGWQSDGGSGQSSDRQFGQQVHNQLLRVCPFKAVKKTIHAKRRASLTRHPAIATLQPTKQKRRATCATRQSP